MSSLCLLINNVWLSISSHCLSFFSVMLIITIPPFIIIIHLKIWGFWKGETILKNSQGRSHNRAEGFDLRWGRSNKVKALREIRSYEGSETAKKFTYRSSCIEFFRTYCKSSSGNRWIWPQARTSNQIPGAFASFP